MMSLAPLNCTSFVSNFVLTTTVLAKVGSASAHNRLAAEAKPQSLWSSMQSRMADRCFAFERASS